MIVTSFLFTLKQASTIECCNGKILYNNIYKQQVDVGQIPEWNRRGMTEEITCTLRDFQREFLPEEGVVDLHFLVSVSARAALWHCHVLFKVLLLMDHFKQKKDQPVTAVCKMWEWMAFINHYILLISGLFRKQYIVVSKSVLILLRHAA